MNDQTGIRHLWPARLLRIRMEELMKPLGTGQPDEAEPQTQHQDASHPGTHSPQTR